MVTKARPRSRLLCCFTGSLVHDSDELDSTVCQSSSSSSKSQYSLSWSKFRARKEKKKKTVPVDAAVEVVEVSEGDVVVKEVIADKLLLSAAKKSYFHMFHKKGSSKRSHTKLNHREEQQPQKKAISQVLTKCVSPRQPALLCRVDEPEPVQVRTDPSRTAHSSDTIQIKAQEKKKKRFGESDQQMVLVLMLVVTLGTMLLGGRLLAIVCTSGWFYLSAYVKDMSKAAANSGGESRPMTEMIHKI